MARGAASPAELTAQPHTRRSWPLKAYLLGLVVLAVVAAGTNVVYQRRAATDDARTSATADAGFAATIGARDVASAIHLAQTTVASVAANPGIATVFAAPAGCTLTFSGAGAFATGHVDVVGQDGAVACSSLAPTSAGYAGSEWLPGAVEVPTFVGPMLDARTGKQVVLATSPIPGKGTVAAFLDLDALGPGLASSLAGPRNLEFVVTTSDGSVVLGRSIDPDQWVGSAPGATPFAGASNNAEHRDLDGTARIYGQATVDTVGWKVFAGASTSEALAAANGLSNRQLGITLVGLIVFLAAAWLIHRRIARPIGKLSAGVRAATAHTSSEPLALAGPAEVTALVDDFNQLITVARSELETTSRLAAIVESSTDAIVGKTLDGTITSWNATAEHTFGYTADEIIGRNISELMPPDRLDEWSPLLERLRRGERVDEFETKRVRRDGSIIDVSVTVSPVRNASGAVAGASAASRDITSLKRAAADRRVLEERLRQSERLESLGQLAGGIAHDFNNLLAVIMNYAAFVAEETADRPAVRADVDQIQSAAERAARLTKQLLIFGRRETIQPETLDLNNIVDDIYNLLSRSIGEHIELTLERVENLPGILADRGQIEQVLVNLAVNARDAMPDGGTLTLETRPAQLDDGYARLHPNISPGPYVELAVSDTGTGMSKDVANRVFEPFFSTKRRGEGTGLGLATVHGIVTEAGGSMSVYSEEGIGTTFRLYFPATGAPVTAVSSDEAKGVRGTGETILVVEDDPAVLELTSRILRHNGYSVLEAGAYEEAISLAVTHDFDLLLTDSVMPEMSGRLLAERVEELRPGRPVLYMSGYSPGVLGPQRILEKDAALIQKPFNQRALLEKVHTLLSTRSPPLAGSDQR